MVRVAVVALSGAVLLEEDLPGDCSVGELKAKLQPRCGVVANEQQLARGSDILDDGSFLGDLAEEALCLTFVRSLTRMVLSGGRDRKLSLWDLNRSEADCDFEGHAQAVRCLEVDWQSQRALSGSADASLRLWDLARGGHLQLCGHDDSVECLSVCWDTNFALSASLDRSLRMWNVLSGEVTTELLDLPSHALCLEMDWVEHQALCACADGSLLLWGIPGVQRAEKQHLARRLVANWPDMQAIMGCVDGRVMIWDLRLLQVLKTLAEEHPQIICMSAVPNLSELAIGAADGRLYLWSCRGGATAPSKIMDAHSSPVRVLDVDWSGRSALTSGEDGVLKFWNLTMGQCLRVLDGQDPVTCLAVHWPAALAFASAGRITKLWDLCRGRCLQSLATGRSSVISGDWARQRLLSAGEDSMLHLRDAFRRGQCIGHLEGHTDAVLCVSVDWASTRALSGSSDRRLVLWDMAEWKSLRTFHGHRDAVRCLSVDWAKGQALSGSFDRTLLLWDLENEKALASLEGHRDWVCCVCCHWPGRKALSGGREGALKLWDLDTASCTLTLEGHPDAVWSVALNLTEASAGRALSAGRDRQLRLWCLAEGRLLRCLAGHQDAVRSLDVDWASQQVLSCGFDNVLRLWNLESSEHIQEFEGHTRGVTCCSVDWTSGMAVSGGEDSTVRLWDIFAEDDASDRVLGGHAGAVLCVSMGCGPSITPRGDSAGPDAFSAYAAWGEQVTRMMAGRVIF